MRYSGKPCMWYSEKSFAFPSSRAPVYKGLIRPILTAEKTNEEGRDLILRKIGSGHGHLHIYASQSPPKWPTRKFVRRNVSCLTTSYVPTHHSRIRIRHPHHQHQRGQGIACYTEYYSTCSTTIYYSKYSINTDWRMKKVGITNLGGANSPTFVEIGGTSYMNFRFTWTCILSSRIASFHWIRWLIYHFCRSSSTIGVGIPLMTVVYFTPFNSVIAYAASSFRFLPRHYTNWL